MTQRHDCNHSFLFTGYHSRSTTPGLCVHIITWLITHLRSGSKETVPCLRAASEFAAFCYWWFMLPIFSQDVVLKGWQRKVIWLWCFLCKFGDVTHNGGFSHQICTITRIYYAHLQFSVFYNKKIKNTVCSSICEISEYFSNIHEMIFLFQTNQWQSP